jgi:hypothetical protein
VVAAVALAAILAVPAAPAAEPRPATPQQIYRDITDNGRLDRRYRAQDIERALRVSSDDERRLSSSPQPSGPAPKTSDPGARDVILREFPFSRLDVALLGGVAAVVLLLAGAVRLRTRLAPLG